jgi:hypothetical protein
MGCKSYIFPVDFRGYTIRYLTLKKNTLVGGAEN